VPGRFGWLALAALAVSVFSALVALWSGQRADHTVREAARHWQDAETRLTQAEQQLKLAQDNLRDVLARSAVLESKLSDTAGQLAQMERIYRNIAQDSVDAALADVENALLLAAQQLVVGANVQGALVALQDAEARLKRADAATVSPLRRLIARDADRLRAVPITDLTSLAVRLETIASALDQLPPVSGESLAARSPPQPPDAAQGSTLTRLTSSSLEGWNILKSELLALIRVNRVDEPDALLLAPSERYFVTQNLRLSLLSARLSLLARNEALFRSDVARSIEWLSSYYDRDQRAVRNAISALRQIQASRIAVELPSLAESLGMVRAMRAARESAR
jgi:uncharacterized protein HemX